MSNYKVAMPFGSGSAEVIIVDGITYEEIKQTPSTTSNWAIGNFIKVNKDNYFPYKGFSMGLVSSIETKDGIDTYNTDIGKVKETSPRIIPFYRIQSGGRFRINTRTTKKARRTRRRRRNTRRN
jgi:hypothetical protein